PAEFDLWPGNPSSEHRAWKNCFEERGCKAGKRLPFEDRRHAGLTGAKLFRSEHEPGQGTFGSRRKRKRLEIFRPVPKVLEVARRSARCLDDPGEDGKDSEFWRQPGLLICRRYVT